MTINILLPADTEYLSAAPAEIRANVNALKDDKIVNAAKLVDLVPGNATGNIPVSNGALNVNSNADMLDGQHGSYYSPTTHTHAVATTSSAGLESGTDKTKLDGIAALAEVNQMAFSNVLVGTTTIIADTKTDTLTILAGLGITLTPDAVNDAVTILLTNDGTNATHIHAAGTDSTAGFVSAADHAKLTGIATGAEVNQMAFSNIVAGGVTAVADSKTDTFTINAGTGITVTGDATNDACTITVTQDGHSHAVGTTGAAGFISTPDKTKLDGLAAGAQVNQNAFSNVLVGSTTIVADSVTDTLTMIAGTNILLTPDATNDTVTIAVTGTVSSATTAAACTGNSATATTATTATTTTGNAGTSTKLATARTIALSGKVTGTATSFDGSSAITIPVTAVVADSCIGNSATATTALSVPWTGLTGASPIVGHGKQLFTANGTFTVPAGVTQLWATVVGGGSGGSGGTGGNSRYGGGYGGVGGNGGSAKKNVDAIVVTPLQAIVITIGAGGAGGVGGAGSSLTTPYSNSAIAGTAGATGGLSSFGSYLSASGGIASGVSNASATSTAYGLNGSDGMDSLLMRYTFGDSTAIGGIAPIVAGVVAGNGSTAPRYGGGGAGGAGGYASGIAIYTKGGNGGTGASGMVLIEW